MSKFSRGRGQIIMIDEIVSAMGKVSSLGLLLITAFLLVARVMAG